MLLSKPKAVKDCKTVVDYAYRHRYAYLTNVESFNLIFKKPLKSFWDGNLLGFDIVAFDKWVNPDQKLSLREFLSKNYSDDSVKLIEKLLTLDQY